MTIFAYDGQTLVSDSAEYKYGIIVNDKVVKPKIIKCGDLTAVVTGAGSTAWIMSMQAWLEREIRNYRGRLSHDDYKVQDVEGYKEIFDAGDDYDNIVLLGRGGDWQGYYFGKHPYPRKVNAPYAGGHQDAVLITMGAMHAGTNAEMALNIAVKLTGIAPINGITTVIPLT